MKTLLVVVLLVCCALGALADKERGCSLSLDGSKRLVLDRFVQGDGDNGVIMTDATFEAWIHPAKSTSGTIVQTGLIQMRSSPLTSQVLHYHNKQLMVVVYTASGTDNQARIYHTNTEVHPGRWTHVTMHISQSLNATIHINGEHAELEQYSFAGVTDFPVDPPPRRFAIGGEFEGEIDEVKLWDSLRVPTMHACDSTEGLVMYLPFNECSGNITADLGSSASCGRMRNATNGWGEGDMRRGGGGGRGQWRHHAHHMHGEDGLHPVPFYIENMPQMVEERELPQSDGKRDHDGKHKDHEHDGKHDGGHDGKHDGDHHDGKQDGKHDGEHDGKHDGEHDGKQDGEHDGKHKHGGGEHHKCRGASITFGSPAPGASCATNFPPADINKQCPYSSFMRHHHHGSDASSSESSSSSSDDDSESSSDGDSESDSSDEASGVFWTNVFVASMVFAFVMFCCITKRKMKNATAATHQPLPTGEQQQQEFEGYPGNHPLAVAPQFVVNVADGDFATVVDVPLSFEEHQPFMMYPAEMGVYQQHAAPPFMYYMPQPVYYAPNAERVEGE